MTQTYLEKLRGIKNGTSLPTMAAKPKQIAKRSEKMKAEMKKYKPAAKKFLSENKICEIKFKGCTNEATQVHHRAGRLGSRLHDQSEWVATCSNCHLKIEIQDLESRSLGHLKSKLAI